MPTPTVFLSDRTSICDHRFRMPDQECPDCGESEGAAQPDDAPDDGACDHPFRVTGDVCLNCGEWDTNVEAMRARIRRLEILGAQMAAELGAESIERLNQAAGRAVEIQSRVEKAALDELAQAELYNAAIRFNEGIRLQAQPDAELTQVAKLTETVKRLEAQLAVRDQFIADLKAQIHEDRARFEAQLANEHQWWVNAVNAGKRLQAQLATATSAMRAAEDLQLTTAAELDEKTAQLAEAQRERDYERSWKETNAAQAEQLTQTVEALTAQLAKAQKTLDEQHQYLVFISEEKEKTEAQLAEANARAETAERRAEDADFNSGCEIKEKMRLRAALEAVERYMASEESPLYNLWENGDICDYDDNPVDTWVGVLDELRNFSIDPVILGHGVEWLAVNVYREVLAALNPRGEGEE